MSKMKKVALAAAVAVAFAAGFQYDTAQKDFAASPAYAAAMDYSAVQSVLRKLAGNWYDSKGRVAIYIRDNYINDCEVLGGRDFAGGASLGGGYFDIQEDTGVRALYIEWNARTFDGMAPYLIINKGEKLHR